MVADAKKIVVAAFLILALILHVGFCAWNQTLAVNVSNQNGVPVSGASVKIIYQKINGITGNDGMLEGYTDDAGIYSANISNTVPVELESKKITVNVNTSQWAGEEKEVEANNAGVAITVRFVAPILLEKVAIIVLQPDGNEAPGASIYITDDPITRIADSTGRIIIYVAEGRYITGFASYQSEGNYFSSANATIGVDGGKEILVRLPAPPSEVEEKANRTNVSVRFIAMNNTPISGEKIVFYADGIEVPSYTDDAGIATIDVYETWELCAMLHKNDYDYFFSFNITADGIAKEEAAILFPLLKLEYFGSKPDGPGCYRLSAKVSDPRTNRQLSIKFIPLQEGSTLGELPISLDENNFYFARVCTDPDVLIRAVASNTYETVEETISLTHSPPLPPPLAQTNAIRKCMLLPFPQENVTANGTMPPTNETPSPAKVNATNPPLPPPPVAPPSPKDEPNPVIVGIVILVVVMGAVVIVRSKNPNFVEIVVNYFTHLTGNALGTAMRPILEYLRSIFRKNDPPSSSFGRGG